MRYGGGEEEVKHSIGQLALLGCASQSAAAVLLGNLNLPIFSTGILETMIQRVKPCCNCRGFVLQLPLLCHF